MCSPVLDGSVVVGHAGRARPSEVPNNAIVSVKRYMGRDLRDIGDTASTPYRFVDAPGMVQLATRQGVKSPVEISSDILDRRASCRERVYAIV